MSHVQSMRELFSYVDRFKGSRFVVKIDDPLVSHERFPSLLADLARLTRIGVHLLIVAGARTRIDDVLSQYGVKNRRHGPVRVSSTGAMPLIEMAAFDVATKIMTGLSGLDIDAVIGNFVRARTLGVVDGVDFQSTGCVDRIDLTHLERLIDDGLVPILPCIGWSRRGIAYNVSSNQLAGALAEALHAEKLIFCLSEDSGLPARIAAGSQTEAAHTDSTTGNEIVSIAVHATTHGVERAHVVNALEDGVLLTEIFTNLGAGSMIYTTGYESIRPYRRQTDLASVSQIVSPYAQSGRLRDRSESELDDLGGDLVVYDIDGTVHGVAGLTGLDDATGELFSVAVDESVADLGVGRKLVAYLIDAARDRGYRSVIVLTTQAFDWFNGLGFEPATIDDLPEHRRASYDPSRNSRILIKRLVPASR